MTFWIWLAHHKGGRWNLEENVDSSAFLLMNIHCSVISSKLCLKMPVLYIQFCGTFRARFSELEVYFQSFQAIFLHQVTWDINNINFLIFLILQIYSSRELEETLNKIREILSDDKHDWDQRTNAVNFLSGFRFGWVYFIKHRQLDIWKCFFLK